MKLFTGNANPHLAEKVAYQLGLPLGHASVDKFSDGEIRVEILENVRGQDVFILQPTCAPCNTHLMELVIMADACRRASAASITAVIPYFGYARQDRRIRSARVPITAKVVADMLASVGFSRVITIDLHADQIQGFFYMPVDNIYASALFIDHMCATSQPEDIAVVSPDVGGVIRARAVAKQLHDAHLAIIDKRRSKDRVEAMHLIGDVEGKHCVLVDDMIDTAGTICQAATALREHGAKSVTAYATHPVLSGNAIRNLEQSALNSLVVTDTIPLSDEAKQCPKIKQISLDALLAETIIRVSKKESVSSLFVETTTN
jgi:ribose-phosphate pyrophosphokinase